MNIEIEAKIKLDSHKPVIEKLRTLDGAVFDREIQQTDTFFVDAEEQLFKKGCGLRLRREKSSSAERLILTYKGPKMPGIVKSRPEIETCVDNHENMALILESLGYNRRLTFRKTRKIWLYAECEICLDYVPRLGYFLEVEGPSEQVILEVLNCLGQIDVHYITDGYAKMISKLIENKDL